jgi:diphthamide biosynthesis protein 7
MSPSLIYADSLFGCTGSYDEQLRFWDERKLNTEVDSLNVGGGIWRIKQQPPQPGGSSSSNDDALLIAAMHGGFLVLTKDAEVGIDTCK